MVLTMKKWEGAVAVVTGASSGIGEAIVKKLVKEGMTVVGLARRIERMQIIAENLKDLPGKFYPLSCDLSLESDILNCFDSIRNNIGPVSVLINNAGRLVNTTLAEGETKVWNDVLAVNVLGLCIATREAVKDMKKHNIHGHIIHINSICGHYSINLENLNIYPATKHAVSSLSETLRKEFARTKTKIKVTSISPGIVDTEIFSEAGMNFVTEGIKSEDVPSLSPDDIAEAIEYVLSTAPIVNISELIIQPINEAL